MSKRPMTDRFWEKVNKSGDCWEWTACKMPTGYGHFQIDSKSGGYAHRISYQLAYGPIPAGLHVLHRCDNPGCVRPDHLFLGTPTDNMKDRDRKGRQAKGERQGFSKLTNKERLMIRKRYNNGETIKSLADEFHYTISGMEYVVFGPKGKPLNRPSSCLICDAPITQTRPNGMPKMYCSQRCQGKTYKKGIVHYRRR